MNLAVHINARTMIHGLMAETADGLFVSPEIIGADHVNVLVDVVLNEGRECARSNIFGAEEIQVAFTLANADHDLFTDRATPFNLLCSFAGVHVLRLAADIRFVHLYRAVKHLAIRLAHRTANPVAEIPSRLIAYAKRAFNLISRHTLARLAQEID